MFETITSQGITSVRPIRLPRWSGLMALVGLHRQRRALAALTPEQLTDVGITPQDAATEAERPFWDIPANWRG